MSTLAINNPSISAPAGTAVAPHRLATINADGEADYGSTTDTPIGVTTEECDAGALQGLRLFSAGVTPMTAAGAIARLAPVYAAASGKVSATAVDGGRLIGIALEAAGADGDLIQVLPQALAALIAQTVAAATYVAPAGGATVDAEARAALAQLAADVAAIRAALVASTIFAAA